MATATQTPEQAGNLRPIYEQPLTQCVRHAHAGYPGVETVARGLCRACYDYERYEGQTRPTELIKAHHERERRYAATLTDRQQVLDLLRAHPSPVAVAAINAEGRLPSRVLDMLEACDDLVFREGAFLSGENRDMLTRYPWPVERDDLVHAVRTAARRAGLIYGKRVDRDMSEWCELITDRLVLSVRETIETLRAVAA